MSAGGARPAVFYLLAHGEVDAFVGGTHRRSLGPNDFFGEISMLVLVPATATVVTRTPVRAYVMSHSQFLEVRVHETVMLQLKSAMGAAGPPIGSWCPDPLYARRMKPPSDSGGPARPCVES